MKLPICTLLTAVLALAILQAIGQQTTPTHTFAIQGDHFALDGKPFKILSGELHYAGIPREYWHARLKMAKAMGLNTIATYVFWNIHEPTPNHFDFTGNNDVAAFIRAAQEERLWVILRRVPHPSQPHREGWDEPTQTGEACLPPIPATPPVITIPAFILTESMPLWANLPAPIHSNNPKPMEQFDQAYGYILYRHQLPAAVSGNLVLNELHDYARIYLDGKLAGTLDRRDKQSILAINTTAPAQLDILVENSARINFSQAMRGESKGITKSVTLAGAPLTDWQIYPLPMTTLPTHYAGPHLGPVVRGNTGDSTWTGQPIAHGSKASFPPDSPVFYRAHFTLTTTGDTFLDVRRLGKGAVWINGHPIGRFWNIGPQQTLYVPGPWLHKGPNEIVVFDLAPSTSIPTVAGLATPILDGPVIDTGASAKQE